MCKRKKKMTPEERTAQSNETMSAVMAAYGCEKIEDMPIIQQMQDGLKFPLLKETDDRKNS